jgi:APA family basic amino acid/polyamine antiporter
MEKREKGLKKVLTLLDVFCIASGAMISSGLFILPALAYAKAGPSVIFSYLLAGILVLPAMLSKAELVTAMPKAGGVYFFLERSMGAPIGTIGGLASWFSLSFKSAFALVGMGVFATLIDPGISPLHIKLIAVTFCLFFMILNIIGVRHSGSVQVLLVVALIGILLMYIIRGSNFIAPDRYVPFMPHGLAAVFATAGFVFISFGGLTKVCCVAEEVKHPGRNIPLGMFLAFSVVMLLYVAVVFITVGLLDPSDLSRSLTPISLGARVSMGNAGSIALALAALLAFISTANAGILTASRDALAMGRDYILPLIFHRVNNRFKTPHVAILFTGLFMVFIILFLSLEDLVKTASTLMILLFILVNLSLIVMRESKLQSYRPRFRAPLYPWIQIFGILGYVFLLFEMGYLPLSITGLFVICAFIWYLVYARKRVNRQAALVHVIERITATELVNATLPDELKEIIIERDKIVEDRFDKVINESEILDIDEPLTMERLFGRCADILAKDLDVSKETVYEQLMKREKESSTVIRPGLAIPHIVVKGEGKFRILLARCKEGATFPDVDSMVHIVFMLAGSRDERNFHLRALAAIAEIAQASDFDSTWMAARNADELRDIILLAERKRFHEK